MKFTRILKRACLIFFGMLSALAVNAQSNPDIMLYTTDFTGWAAFAEPGSNGTYPQSTGDGNGFVLSQKPGIYPAGTISGFTGYVTNASSSWSITSKSFDFVSGGVVDMWYCVDQGSAATVTISDANYVRILEIQDPSGVIADYKNIKAGSQGYNKTTGTSAEKKQLDETLLGQWFSGDNATLRYQGTWYHIQFSLPASAYTGAKTVVLSDSKQTDKVVALTYYTSVGNTPYVAAVDYPNAGADGSKTPEAFKLQGEVGAAQVSGDVAIKGFNLTQDVQLSIVGQDAAKFSLGAATMSAADVMAGANVTVNFTPSVKASSATALLKISSGSNDYYVNLVGTTGSGNPQIVASTSQLNFWTSLIATTTQTLDVSGLNLTGPVSATITGAGASRFTLSSTELSLAEATRGSSLTITFTGDIKAGELPANLVLSSAGAQSVTIPLNGVTSLLRPVMYPLTFDVSPTGTAYVETNPGGTEFLEGTQVTVTVTLEKGYKVARWQDASGNTRSTRVFVVSESKNTMSGDPITVFTEKGQQSEGGDDPVEVKGLVALEATNITANSMTANWTPQDGNANGYIVTVTDASGNVVATQQAASTATSVEISGLDENTLYYYTVEGTGTEGTVTTEKVGGFKTPSTTVKVCGSDDYND